MGYVGKDRLVIMDDCRLTWVRKCRLENIAKALFIDPQIFGKINNYQ